MKLEVETEEGLAPIQVSLHDIKPRHQEAAQEFLSEHPKSLPCYYVSLDNLPDFYQNFDVQNLDGR